MHIRSRAVLAVLIAAFVGGLLPTVARSAPAEHVVMAGALLPEEQADKPYEISRFYPSVREVHRGDTVRWDFYGFHSISFLPGDEIANQKRFFVREELGDTGFNNDVDAASGCGVGDESPCVLSNTDAYVGSGAPQLIDPEDFSKGALPFRATFDLAPGTYRYHCNYHTRMQGFVRVVPDATPLTQTEDVPARIAQDIADADAYAARPAQFETTPEGHTRWFVKAGGRTDAVEILSFIPPHVDIAPGDEVRFVADGTFHGVGFPQAAVDPVFGPFGPVGWSAIGTPWCDLDDDPQGGLPDVPGFLCDLPEFHLSPWVTSPVAFPGNIVATPVTPHESGLMAPEDQPAFAAAWPDGSRLPSTLDAVFPAPGDFPYACIVHGSEFMPGGVTVA
jgi:plastocyanin